MTTARRIAIAAATAIGLFVIGMPITSQAAAVTCAGQAATIIGTSGNDVLIGTSGPDVIAGLAGNDRIRGRGGNDRICGGFGADVLSGGPGHDFLSAGGPRDENGNDHLRLDLLMAGPGNDVFHVPGRPRWTPARIRFAKAPRSITYDSRSRQATGWGKDRVTGRGQIRVEGSAYDDTMLGSVGPDIFLGGLGDDYLAGRRGEDELHGARGNNTLLGGRGDDFITGDHGSQTVHGGPGGDAISIGDDGKPDRVRSGGGDDRIFATVTDSEEQLLAGGAGRDRLILELRVRENGEAVPVRLTTDLSTGITTFTDLGVAFPLRSMETVNLTVGKGVWTVVGSDNRDVIETGWNTRLVASLGGGNDVARGSRKDDWVDGGDGVDTVFAYDGTDTCINVERTPYDDCEIIN